MSPYDAFDVLQMSITEPPSTAQLYGWRQMLRCWFGKHYIGWYKRGFATCPACGQPNAKVRRAIDVSWAAMSEEQRQDILVQAEECLSAAVGEN